MNSEKGRLGKVKCCGVVLGWLKKEAATFCPRCGRTLRPQFVEAPDLPFAQRGVPPNGVGDQHAR